MKKSPSAASSLGKSSSSRVYAVAVRHPQRSRVPTPPPNYKSLDLSNVRFEYYAKYRIDDNGYFPLERKIIFPMNDGEVIKCHCTYSGMIFIFHMSSHDVSQLNSLLYQLVRLKGLNHGLVHYLSERSAGSNRNPVVFHFDKDTRMFNAAGQSVSRCDYIDVFKGRVALAIKGLFVVDDSHIYLDLCVHQVKIDQDVDAQMTASDECMFQ